jgi:hypothetical protein
VQCNKRQKDSSALNDRCPVVQEQLWTLTRMPVCQKLSFSDMLLFLKYHTDILHADNIGKLVMGKVRLLRKRQVR